MIRGRYVRIGALKVVYQGDIDPVLNLAEVQAFGPSDTLLNAIGATLSSTHSSGDFPASRCIDGILVGTNQQSLCHSGTSDKDPVLVIDYGKVTEITSIRVFNRQENVETTSRIDGATISITADTGGQDTAWASTFEGAQSMYTFQVAAGV